MAGEQQASINIDVIKTSEQPFIPGQTTTVFAELTPTQQTQSTFYSPDYSQFYSTIQPQTILTYQPLPTFTAPASELILNVETTTLNPWEGRIMNIAVLDPNELNVNPMIFFDENEETMINAFLDFFEASAYNTFIGYNVSFDYRFLYAVMQRYRKNAPNFMQAKLYDLMEQQKQVKQSYVYGSNPTGKLDEWIDYLFGVKPFADQKQVYAWWQGKEYEKIAEFNADKAIRAYSLWVLNKVVEGSIPEEKVAKRYTGETSSSPASSSSSSTQSVPETINVQCSQCKQEQAMNKTDKVINCFICGNPIANPML